MSVIGGAYCILEGRDNYIYIILNIRIILYYGINNKINLILLSILKKNILNNLYLLNNCKIYNNDGNHIIKHYIYVWLLVNILN
jgi:hypothetical protein